MNNSNSYTIKRKEGLNFSKISADRNKIHTDNLAGYNSIFGTTICHGVLVIFKFFKIINIKKKIKDKKKFSISIEFKKYVIYDIDLRDGTENIVKLDVENLNSLRQIKGVDTIINLAAVHRDDVKPISRYDSVNIGGAENICDAERRYNINK